MDEEVNNLSRLWDKPGEKAKPDPMSLLDRGTLAEIRQAEKLWKSEEKEPPVNEGILKQVLCHSCRMGFETKKHDKDIRCPGCGSKESLSIYL